MNEIIKILFIFIFLFQLNLMFKNQQLKMYFKGFWDGGFTKKSQNLYFLNINYIKKI